MPHAHPRQAGRRACLRRRGDRSCSWFPRYSAPVLGASWSPKPEYRTRRRCLWPRSGVDTTPSPCPFGRWGIGYRASHKSAFAAVWLPRSCGNLAEAHAFGIDHFVQQANLFGCRLARSGDIVGDDELKAGGFDHFFDGDAWVQRTDAHAVVFGLEVENAKVADDGTDFVAGLGSGVELFDVVVAHA